MKKSLFSCLADQFRSIPPLPSPTNSTTSLQDKTVLITGANTGLGFETAKHLAQFNPSRLILACRNLDKGNAAAKRIKEEVGAKFDGTIEVWVVDLADFESVKAFVNKVVGGGGEGEVGLERLDLVVLNAGVAQHTDLEYIPTKDGFEHALQINNISQSWIALRLMPLITKTAETFKVQARVIVVGSEVHYWGHIPDEVLNSTNAWRVLGSREYCSGVSVLLRRYFDSKLLNLLFTRSLNNRLKSKSIITTCVNPGLCHSELRRDVQGLAGVFLALYERIFARKTEDGGRIIAWACICNVEGGDQDTLKGGYVNAGQVEEPADFALGEEGKRREDKLWNDLVDLLMDIDEDLKDALSASFL